MGVDPDEARPRAAIFCGHLGIWLIDVTSASGGFAMDMTNFLIIFAATLFGGLLHNNAHARGKYDDFGPLQKHFSGAIIMFAVYILLFTPYVIWKSNGLHPLDAKNAESMMAEKYVSQGAEKAEANFIVASHSTLKGYVDLTYPDGTRLVVKCEGTKGELSRILVTCNA